MRNEEAVAARRLPEAERVLAEALLQAVAEAFPVGALRRVVDFLPVARRAAATLALASRRVRRRRPPATIARLHSNRRSRRRRPTRRSDSLLRVRTRRPD